jgi:hypothetical protein
LTVATFSSALFEGLAASNGFMPAIVQVSMKKKISRIGFMMWISFSV